MIIRLTRETDIASLLELQGLAIDAGYPSPLRERLLDDPTICAAEFRRCWQGGDSFITACVDRKNVGYACVTASTDTFELSALFVHPGHWRSGIGTRLIAGAAVAAAKRGATEISVKANPLFTAFYEVNGFRQISIAEMDGMLVPTMVRAL